MKFTTTQTQIDSPKIRSAGIFEAMLLAKEHADVVVVTVRQEDGRHAAAASAESVGHGSDRRAGLLRLSRRAPGPACLQAARCGHSPPPEPGRRGARSGPATEWIGKRPRLTGWWRHSADSSAEAAAHRAPEGQARSSRPTADAAERRRCPADHRRARHWPEGIAAAAPAESRAG